MSKNRHPGILHCTFFSPEKLVLLSLLKKVKPSSDSKMIKLLTSDNLFPPLRPLVVDWRRLPRFPAKMTLFHAPSRSYSKRNKQYRLTVNWHASIYLLPYAAPIRSSVCQRTEFPKRTMISGRRSFFLPSPSPISFFRPHTYCKGSGRKNVLRKLLRIPYRRLTAGFSVCWLAVDSVCLWNARGANVCSL